MSITLESVVHNGNGKIDVRFTYYANTSGFTYYIGIRNENSNYYDYGYSNYTSSSALESVTITASLTNQLLCTDTNYYFKIKILGQTSNEVSIFLPFLGTLQSDYMISERPTQQTQYVFYDGVNKGEAGSCVANTLASIKEVQEIRNGKTVLQYSVGWIYGMCGDGSTESLQYESSLNLLQQNGVPPYVVVSNSYGVNGYPDVYKQPEAKAVYNANKTQLTSFALPQKIGSWNRIEGFNNIMTAIKNNTVMMTLMIDSSMDSAYSNGIVGGLTGSNRGGHAMIVLGWTTISGRKHWICQNSWCYTNGTPLGDGGLYYIPFDWYSPSWNGINYFYEVIDDPNAPALPPIPETLTPPYLKSEDSTSITMAWSGLIGSTNYELRIRDENGGYTTYQTKNLEYRLNNLSYGYRYWISLRAYRGGVWTNYTNETKVITKPRYANISRVYSTTPNNLLVELDTYFVTGRFTGFEIRRHTYPYTDTILDRKYNYTLNGTSEWTGLTTGSRFSFTTMTFLDLDEGRIWSIYRSTEVDGTVGNIRPPYFSWDTQKVKGNPFSDLKASEWIGLINNIKLMMTYKGLNPSNYTFTLPNKGDTFMVSHWTQVRNAIYNTLNSSVYIPSKSKGAQIKADDINLLVTSLNSIK